MIFNLYKLRLLSYTQKNNKKLIKKKYEKII